MRAEKEPKPATIRVKNTGPGAFGMKMGCSATRCTTKTEPKRAPGSFATKRVKRSTKRLTNKHPICKVRQAVLVSSCRQKRSVAADRSGHRKIGTTAQNRPLLTRR